MPQIERPTAVVFDLDPGEGATIMNCCEVALLLRALFDGLKLESFAKVSGSKGIQVYVPLNTATTYDPGICAQRRRSAEHAADRAADHHLLRSTRPTSGG